MVAHRCAVPERRMSGIIKAMAIAPDEAPDGSLMGPDGATYRRTDRRLKRRECQELVGAGTPVVTYTWSAYSSGLSWFDAPESLEIWNELFPHLSPGRCRTSPQIPSGRPTFGRPRTV